MKETLGTADDICDGNGDTILNWKQALDKATKWFEQQAAGGKKLNPNMTVEEAVQSYIAARDAREKAKGGRAHSTAYYNLGRHVLPDTAFQTIKLCSLSEADLRAWQRRLPSLAGSTKQRVLSDLKAALNDAFVEHRQALPNDLLVTIKFGCRPVFAEEAASEPEARNNQVLADNKIRSILNSVQAHDPDGDNFALAIVLAATGARFSQVARMKVHSAELERACLFVPPSRKGRGKKVGAPIRLQIGQDVVEALRSYVEGRAPDEPLLVRWHYRQIKATEWERAGRHAWKSASEMQRWWATAVDAAGMPGVIPYALRHSSIVRAIRAGVPIRLVAAMHDTSVAMIEKHYARWITESLDDIAARAIIPLLAKAA